MRAHSSFDPRRLTAEFVLGFLYWLVFVLVLEPGNLMRWTPPDAAAWGREALRLACAGLLGAAATPTIVAMSRRFPIMGGKALRRGALHLAFGAGVTVALIVASCVLARALPHHPSHPFVHEVGVELAANGLLVAAWIGGMTALVHAVRTARQASPRASFSAAALSFRQRGRFTRLNLAAIAWIETQGNYLALHGEAGVRLVRTTAKALAVDLESAGFVRVHRRTIVALDAVREVRPLAAGDAMLRLADGTELRVSRTCRPELMAALDERRS